MAGRYLLDTNVVIALFANEAAVIKQLADASQVFVPSIALGELYYGARKSGRVEQNMARLDELAASNVLLSCDIEVACRYGQVKDSLRQRGQPIPENDIWIAAVALQHDLTLVSRDEHFRQVGELSLQTW